MSAERPALRALADRLGIRDGYRDVEGRDRHTSDATREALASAMGHEACDEAGAGSALEALDRQSREQILEPVLVWREWKEGRPELHVNTHTLGGSRDYVLELELEEGHVERTEGHLPEPGPTGTVAVALPMHPPYGYHEVRLAVTGAGAEYRASQRLVMAPRTAFAPEEVLGEGRSFGIWANLYAIRSAGDWGHGGLRELTRLGRLAGEAGAAFVGINPLHAVTNRGLEFSPYSPSSRLFRNTLYLDPEAVPELGTSAAARSRLSDPSLRRRRAALEAASHIDHEAVLDLMLPILRELHRSFTREAKPAHKEAYARYREREGTVLRDFATWETLAEHHTDAGGPPGTAWWRWPEPLRDPRSAAVEAFRGKHADDIDFRCWLQFELDRQLESAACSIRASGCALGLYHDLALGSSDASADTWMAPNLFAKAVHVGAPPDAYAPKGQDWGLPPFDPHRLRADGYRSWSRLLRAAFSHAGALRIDHAMGLMRLFWIPAGRSGDEGAYVTCHAEDLLGVLALESRRHRSIVVAEDLGTLPPELPGLLADWGLLRSAVVYFEREGDRFRSPAQYPPRALATVGTHDLAPLAGYFEGADLRLRHQAGGFESDAAFEVARTERGAERAHLVAALHEAKCLPDESDSDENALRDGVHAFLAATPSTLIGVSLDDLAGEREPVNLPGVPPTAHRSWSRRMGRALEDLADSPELDSALKPLQSRSRRPRPRG